MTIWHIFSYSELGPTLLFVKVNQGKEETRRFYACSACRDRKDCNFFQWEDEKVYQLFGYLFFIFDVRAILMRMYEVNRLRDENTLFFGSRYWSLYLLWTYSDDWHLKLLSQRQFFKTFWGVSIGFAKVDFSLKSAGHGHSRKCFRKTLLGKHFHWISFIQLLGDPWKHLERQLWAWYPLGLRSN